MVMMRVKKVHGRTGAGFIPHDRAAEIELEKLPAGRILKAEVTTPRNIKHNGLMFGPFFSSLAKILNEGPGRNDWDQNSVRKRLLIITGHADLFELPPSTRAAYGLTPDQVVMGFSAKSMAFDSMDQEEASRFYEKALAYVLSNFHWAQEHPDWKEIEALGRENLRESAA